jgi:magnesium transporter
MTLSRPRAKRRKRHSSSANLCTLQSERDLAAKYRARAESRHIPREFVLYLPPSLYPRAAPAKSAVLAGTTYPQRVSHTSSLPLILGQLDMVLKKSEKARRIHRSRPMSPGRLPADPASFPDYMLPLAPSHPVSVTDLGVPRIKKKGKEKGPLFRPHTSPPMSIPIEMGEGNRAPKAWWLDVSSPTWEDMRAIGKVNNLNYIWDFGRG